MKKSALAACIALFNLQMAHAEHTQLDTVTVTASREGEQNLQQPLSIGLVNQQQLEQENGGHLANSLNSIAGTYLIPLHGGQGHMTAIRMPLNTQGYYLFLQDNLPVQSAGFFNHNGLWWTSYQTGASGVEVLKGAGTVLHGSNAVAGTVNVLSAQPEFSNTGSLSVDGNDQGYHKLRLQQNYQLNDNQAINVGLSRSYDEGWRDHTANERQEINLQHLYQGDGINVRSQLLVSDLRNEMASALDKTTYENDRNNDGLPASVRQYDPTRETAYARLSSQITLNLRNGDELSFIPYLRQNNNDYVATWKNFYPKTENSYQTTGLLAKYNHQYFDGSQTTIGSDLEYTVADDLTYQPVDITVSSKNYVAGSRYFDDEIIYQANALFIQHEQQIGEKLRLAAGLRYDTMRFELNNNLAATDDDGFGNRSLADRSDDFSHLSRKFSAQYQYQKNAALYARISESFRTPTGTELYQLSKGDNGSLADGVSAETATTYEIGHKFLGAHNAIDFAIYHMQVEDAISNAYDSDGNQYRTNAGQVLHRGVEVAYLQQISDQVQFQISATRAEHRYLKFIVNQGKSNEQDLSGHEMAQAPRYLMNSRIFYKPAALPELNTQLEYQVVADYWMDDTNSKRYGGFHLLNAKAHYQFNAALSSNLRIENLLDTQYASQVDIAYNKERYTPAAPRSIFAGINYQW